MLGYPLASHGSPHMMLYLQSRIPDRSQATFTPAGVWHIWKSNMSMVEVISNVRKTDLRGITVGRISITATTCPKAMPYFHTAIK